MRWRSLSGVRLSVASQWWLGALVALALGSFLVALNLAQLTSPGTGQRILRRAVAVLTDIDAQLPQLQEELQAAAASAEGDSVSVPNFPIPVELPREEAAVMAQETLRRRLLEESGRQAYQKGLGVLSAADPEARRDVGLFSTAGAIDRGLGLITEDNHARIRIAAAALGVLTALLAALLLAAVRSFGRLLTAGGILLAASLPPLAVGVALRFGFRAAQAEADPFVNGLLALGMDTMGVPIRNCMALAALGGALLALGVAWAWIATGRLRPSPVDTG